MYGGNHVLKRAISRKCSLLHIDSTGAKWIALTFTQVALTNQRHVLQTDCKPPNSFRLHNRPESFVYLCGRGFLLTLEHMSIRVQCEAHASVSEPF